MGAYYLFKGMGPGVDALSTENVLAFTIGPITGAPISGNARHCVAAKSPLTGGIASSEGGGFWGPELGAVMGAKNLRAAAVRGTRKPELHEAGRIQGLARIGSERVRAEGFWKDFKRCGTTLNVTWNTDLGGLPTRNWTMGTFAGGDDISAETYAEEMMDTPGTCWACAQSCKRDVKSGITEPWTIEARYGSDEALIRLAEMTGRREGFGDAMAEGTAVLARRLGPQAERLAVHVKGKEFPALMPTSKAVMGLIYAVNPFGPDHVCTEHDPAIADEPAEIVKGFGIYEGGVAPEAWPFEKAKLTAYTERFVSGLSSFSVWQFCFHTWAMYNAVELLEVTKAVTGWDYTMQELMLLGERWVNLMRAFNAREGFSSKDDTLPERLFEDGLIDDGPGKGRRIDRRQFLECREQYYRLNGWDPESGIPTLLKLRELGLGWAAEGVGAVAAG